MSGPPVEKIELLSVDLLDQHRPLVRELQELARSLKIEFGWHYLLDLTWIISQLGSVTGKHIMDAGAGTGLLQWYLAEQGAVVFSVDRTSRAHLPVRIRSRFRVEGLRKGELATTWQTFNQEWKGKRSLAGKAVRQADGLIALLPAQRSSGKVILYNQDLSNLADIPANSLDAVVAVSALEHNQPQALMAVVDEIMRVLKNSGRLYATLTAARDEDHWHVPSSGWCYTDESLRRLFSLDPHTPSNYAQYDRLFTALAENNELRQGLARFYFQSGDNGMPWGRWDPQYLPVGIIKIKKA